jgi:hypothetical protein
MPLWVPGLLLLLILAAYWWLHRFRCARFQRTVEAIRYAQGGHGAELDRRTIAPLAPLRVYFAEDSTARVAAGGWPGFADSLGTSLRLRVLRRGRVESISFAPAQLKLSWVQGDDLQLGPRLALRLTTTAGVLMVAASDPQGMPSAMATRELGQALRALKFDPGTEPSAPRQLLRWALLVPFLLLLGAIIVHQMQRPDHGLTALALGDGVLAAASEEQLFVQHADGSVTTTALAELGIAGPVLQLAFNRSGELLVGDSVRARIWRCTLEPLRCGRLGSRFEVDPGPVFRFLHLPAQDRLLVSNTMHHLLQLVDEDGQVRIEWPSAITGLCTPNGLAVGRDGHLYVADSDHLRVASYRFESDRLAPLRSYRMRAESAHRCVPGADNRGPIGSLAGLPHDRGRPILLAQDTLGQWWVTLGNMAYEPAVVAVFDEQWKQARLLALPAGADPTGLQLYGSDMLIADFAGHGLFRVATDSLALQPTDDLPLARALETINAASQVHLIRSILLLGSLAVLLAGGAWLTWWRTARARERWY